MDISNQTERFGTKLYVLLFRLQRLLATCNACIDVRRPPREMGGRVDGGQ